MMGQYSEIISVLLTAGISAVVWCARTAIQMHQKRNAEIDKISKEMDIAFQKIRDLESRMKGKR